MTHIIMSHLLTIEWKDAKYYEYEFDENYQPDLYYYWDAPLEEDYYWRDCGLYVRNMFRHCQLEKKIIWIDH